MCKTDARAFAKYQQVMRCGRSCPNCPPAPSPAARCRVPHTLPAKVCAQGESRIAVFSRGFPAFAASSCQLLVGPFRLLPEYPCQRCTQRFPFFAGSCRALLGSAKGPALSIIRQWQGHLGKNQFPEPLRLGPDGRLLRGNPPNGSLPVECTSLSAGAAATACWRAKKEISPGRGSTPGLAAARFMRHEDSRGVGLLLEGDRFRFVIDVQNSVA